MSEAEPLQEDLEQSIRDLTPTEQEVELAIREVMKELTTYPYVSTRLTARVSYRSALGPWGSCILRGTLVIRSTLVSSIVSIPKVGSTGSGYGLGPEGTG